MSESSTNDYIGFVFGYQNNRKFYLAAWKRTHSNYDITTNYTGGIKGMQIKVRPNVNLSVVHVLT